MIPTAAELVPGQVIFSSIGDGNCAYNTIAIGIIDQFHRLVTRKTLFDPSSPTYEHYQRLLDLVREKHSERVPARTDFSVEKRIEMFLENLTRNSQTDLVLVQRILGPALRDYVAQCTSVEEVEKGSVIARGYKESIKVMVLNAAPAYPSIPPDFENMPGFLSDLRPILQNSLRDIGAHLGIESCEQIENREQEENILHFLVGLQRAEQETLWKIYSEQPLTQWFEKNGYQAYLQEVNTDFAYVGVEQYKVISRLFGLQINYNNGRGVIQTINVVEGGITPIILDVRLAGNHWNLYLDNDPITQTRIKQYSLQREFYETQRGVPYKLQREYLPEADEKASNNSDTAKINTASAAASQAAEPTVAANTGLAAEPPAPLSQQPTTALIAQSYSNQSQNNHSYLTKRNIFFAVLIFISLVLFLYIYFHSAFFAVGVASAIAATAYIFLKISKYFSCTEKPNNTSSHQSDLPLQASLTPFKSCSLQQKTSDSKDNKDKEFKVVSPILDITAATTMHQKI